jgi:hypothetical protein
MPEDGNAVGRLGVSQVLDPYGKPELSNVWYHAKHIKIDGYKFVSCRFDKCLLIVSSTDFEFIGCHIGDDTELQFGSEVAQPIRLFNLRNVQAYSDLPFFAPVRNADGTITIKVMP